jgi:hypothetical protein
MKKNIINMSIIKVDYNLHSEEDMLSRVRIHLYILKILSPDIRDSKNLLEDKSYSNRCDLTDM